MATPALYQCRLSPAECPTSPHPGYCARHPWIELVAASTVTTPSRLTRPAPHPTTVPPTHPAPPADPTGPATATAEGEPEPGRVPAWALRITALDATVPIPPTGLHIGRDTPRFADLPGMAELDQVSRSHARLTWHGTTLILADLNSTNGTFVAGRRITDTHPVTPGTPVRLADDVDVELIDLDEEL